MSLLNLFSVWCVCELFREDVAQTDGAPGVSGRRQAVSVPDGAVEAVSCSALLQMAVRPLVRVSC